MEPADPDDPGVGPVLGFVYLVTPGRGLPDRGVAAAVILGAIGLGGIVLAFAIVERRRPT